MSYLPLSYYDHPRLHQRESPRLLEAASARREHRAALPGSVKERMLKIWRKLSETTTSDVPHLSYLDLPAMFFCLFYIKGRNSSQNVQNRLVSSQSPFIRIIIHIIPHIEYTVYIYMKFILFSHQKVLLQKFDKQIPQGIRNTAFPFFPGFAGSWGLITELQNGPDLTSIGPFAPNLTRNIMGDGWYPLKSKSKEYSAIQKVSFSWV